MYRTVSFAAIVAAALAVAGPAAAAEGKPSFDKADQNGDGKVSLKEAKEQGFDKYQFFAQDVDQDGMLTEEDWRYISRRSNFNLAAPDY